MSYVTQLSSAARHVSAEQMAQSAESVGIAVLKKQMQVEAQISQQMVQMLNQAQPHLGSNVNITA